MKIRSWRNPWTNNFSFSPFIVVSFFISSLQILLWFLFSFLFFNPFLLPYTHSHACIPPPQYNKILTTTLHLCSALIAGVTNTRNMNVKPVVLPCTKTRDTLRTTGQVNDGIPNGRGKYWNSRVGFKKKKD